jgi:protein TonB
LRSTAIWPTRIEHRFLLIAAALSLAAHGALLALHFTTAPMKSPLKDPGLEIVLMNAATKSAPAHADLLAQVNSDGGGDSERGHARSPLRRSATNREGTALATLHAKQAALEAQQRVLASRLNQRHAAPPPAPRGPDGLPTPAPADADTRAAQLSRQFAAISRRVDDYNKRPRKHFFAPSTSEYRFAAYVEQWRRKVEAVGNHHYPDAARGKVYGSLRMTVYIRSDGTVDRMDIDQPSSHRILNDAARRIVSLAAPFPPFPPQIARDTDILAITRTWHFTNGKLTAGPG